MEIFGEPLKLAILDIDGTVLEMFPHVWSILERGIKKLGLSMKPFIKYRDEVTTGERQFLVTYSSLARGLWPEAVTRVQEIRDCLVEEEYNDPYPATEGALETIQFFRENGVKLATCTTNDENALNRKLRHIGIDRNWFSAASTHESIPRKPDPRAVSSILSQVGVSKEQAVYVGDWPPDLECSTGAGVRFIPVLTGLVPRSYFEQHVPASHIMERMSDILNFIRP